MWLTLTPRFLYCWEPVKPVSVQLTALNESESVFLVSLEVISGCCLWETTQAFYISVVGHHRFQWRMNLERKKQTRVPL